MASEKVAAGTEEVKNSLLNRFISVDIVDATNGEADISSIKKELKKYGFSVKNVTGTKDTTYPETTVVSKTKNQHAELVAAAMELDFYMYNPQKGSGSPITLIVGEDFVKEE